MRAQDAASLSDGQLLDCFIEQAHGSGHSICWCAAMAPCTVWGVCRRVLHNHHDVEDAFQATFLVLVRKAESIIPRTIWSVTGFTGWRIQTGTEGSGRVRETSREGKASDEHARTQNEITKETEGDLQELLDAELNQLTEKYRSVVVLCDLQGKTRKEAAQCLQVPEGTVAGWLARARATLAKRLSKRGLTLPASALAACLTQSAATASIPPALVSATIKATALIAAGEMAEAVLSARVAGLADQVVKGLLLARLKTMMTPGLACWSWHCAAAAWFCSSSCPISKQHVEAGQQVGAGVSCRVHPPSPHPLSPPGEKRAGVRGPGPDKLDQIGSGLATSGRRRGFLCARGKEIHSAMVAQLADLRSQSSPLHAGGDLPGFREASVRYQGARSGHHRLHADSPMRTGPLLRQLFL